MRSSTTGSVCTRPWVTAPRPRRGPAWKGSTCARPRDVLIPPLHSSGGGPVVAAPRAGEAPTPAVLEQPFGAGGLVREPPLEVRQRPGKIRHGAIPPIPLQDWIA